MGAEEQTLSIIKPDAVSKHHIGEIISRFEKNGLKIAALKMVKLSQEEAAQFYKAHEGKPFFLDLTKFISSGPIVAMVLEGKNAVAENRRLMGATDPKKAEAGTLRKDFAASMSQNAVHGSDSIDSAKEEIPFFFKPSEIY